VDPPWTLGEPSVDPRWTLVESSAHRRDTGRNPGRKPGLLTGPGPGSSPGSGSGQTVKSSKKRAQGFPLSDDRDHRRSAAPPIRRWKARKHSSTWFLFLLELPLLHASSSYRCRFQVHW